jgi:prepilin-type N-terminal cleavage/methylation domain-containing protein
VRLGRDRFGFTLIEVILVIVIIGILATVALRSGSAVFQTARVEQTKQELDALAQAMVGNPELHNIGSRSDFGYVGDIGALPPDLDALISNPGGFSTWNGPYIANRFSQLADDFKKDAWGVTYVYNGGVMFMSTGSGNNVVRRVAASADDLLLNGLSGTVIDLNGTPPGSVYSDSLLVRLTIPDAAGGTVSKTVAPDAGGYFAFDSIPIGNHDLEVIYQPNADTLRRFVSVVPKSAPYSLYKLATDVWYDTTGAAGLTKVAGSDSAYSQPQCSNVSFWIANNSGFPVTVASITVNWSSPTAYYRYVRWDGSTVFDSNNPRAGSGDVADFSAVQTLADGDSVKVQIETFKSAASGGFNVDMSNTSFTVLLSDGSMFDVTVGACQ